MQYWRRLIKCCSATEVPELNSDNAANGDKETGFTPVIVVAPGMGEGGMGKCIVDCCGGFWHGVGYMLKCCQPYCCGCCCCHPKLLWCCGPSVHWCASAGTSVALGGATTVACYYAVWHAVPCAIDACQTCLARRRQRSEERARRRRIEVAEQRAEQQLAEEQQEPDPGAGSELRCPVTLELMKDPVIAADGFTYERFAIEQWFKEHVTSPLTNAVLPNTNLTEDFEMLKLINKYKAEHKAKSSCPCLFSSCYGPSTQSDSEDDSEGR